MRDRVNVLLTGLRYLTVVATPTAPGWGALGGSGWPAWSTTVQ